MPVEQCPVTGDRCDRCVPHLLECDEEADRILEIVDTAEYDAEIEATALKLGIDKELFAQFVYDKAFGPGTSIGLNSDSDIF